MTISGTINAHPLMANAPASLPTSPDFKLQTGSPAINTGFDLTGLLTADFAGTQRPQGSGYDIGAYEFGPSSNAAPFPPQNLKVQ